ncbi:hypothetical protein TNCV_202001 [Trichonephila clavipes]|nr:hypothetical protein TNCV_202001 [Trichonephila clavipes]
MSECLKGEVLWNKSLGNDVPSDDILKDEETAVGRLVVRGSDSRPEGLQIPSGYTRSTGSLNQWVRKSCGLIHECRGLENFPPLQFHAKIMEVERGGAAIYRPFGEFRRANSYCHLYGAQGLGQRQAYF